MQHKLAVGLGLDRLGPDKEGRQRRAGPRAVHREARLMCLFERMREHKRKLASDLRDNVDDVCHDILEIELHNVIRVLGAVKKVLKAVVHEQRNVTYVLAPVRMKVSVPEHVRVIQMLDQGGVTVLVHDHVKLIVLGHVRVVHGDPIALEHVQVDYVHAFHKVSVLEHVNVVQMIDHEDVAVLVLDRVSLIVLENVRVIQIPGHQNRLDRVHGRVPKKCVSVSSSIASPRLLENVHKAEARALVRGVHARDLVRDENAELGHVYEKNMGFLVVVGREVVLVRMRQYDVTEVRNVL